MYFAMFSRAIYKRQQDMEKKRLATSATKGEAQTATTVQASDVNPTNANQRNQHHGI